MWIKMKSGKEAFNTDKATSLYIYLEDGEWKLGAAYMYHGKAQALGGILATAPSLATLSALLEDILTAIDEGKRVYYIDKEGVDDVD